MLGELEAAAGVAVRLPAPAARECRPLPAAESVSDYGRERFSKTIQTEAVHKVYLLVQEESGLLMLKAESIGKMARALEL